MVKLYVIEEEIEENESTVLNPYVEVLVPEGIVDEVNRKRVVINEAKSDVKYFHSAAPVKQISQCIVSKDGTVLKLPKPLHVRINHRIGKIFRKKYGKRTILQWIGKCCAWAAVAFGVVFLVGMVVYVFAMFA